MSRACSPRPRSSAGSIAWRALPHGWPAFRPCTCAPRHWREALGSSGTAGAVSQLLAASGVSDGRITPDGLRWCIARCLEAGDIDRLKLPGLRDERRPVIAGGLSLLYTLATHFGIKELMPARGALRQGVIF